MKTHSARFTTLIASLLLLTCQPHEKAAEQPPWPDTMQWWKKNNLRLMQTNLPDYEGGLSPDTLVSDLKSFSANTLLINAGGIMAFYPTRLRWQYTNPYMDSSMLADVISRCHENGIRVVVRFDFSRAHESIFKEHPEWFYVSPQGERINNAGMYLVSINAPYEQVELFNIVSEVLNDYAIDGLFINMFGYHTSNDYEGYYTGIDQNEYEKKRFAEWSGGMKLPVSEDRNDPVFQKYEAFKAYTVRELMERLHRLVKSKSDQIAICTYTDEYVDVIRHESLTRDTPYWPYSASENVNNVLHSYPDKLVSNASIQQISFQSRYNAIEPEEAAIRLYENIANGSGLDISLMGDFRDYEDERNYETWRQVYGHHEKFEAFYGKYSSPARILVITPGLWPGGDGAQELRGIELMLKESHLQFDLMEQKALAGNAPRLKDYRVMILPGLDHFTEDALHAIATAIDDGVHILATDRTMRDRPDVLETMFGAHLVENRSDGSGFYLAPENKKLFKSFQQQSMILWKYDLGFYDFALADTVFLPILTPGRPGPPERIGGHEPSGFYAVGVKSHPRCKAVLLPASIGRLYFLRGYEEHKNIVLDILDYIFPERHELLETDAHPRVECVLQNYVRNTPGNIATTAPEGMILHLVNLTGFSGNTYFDPHPQDQIRIRVKTGFRPVHVFTLTAGEEIDATWDQGFTEYTVPRLGQYEAIVMEK